MRLLVAIVATVVVALAFVVAVAGALAERQFPADRPVAEGGFGHGD